MASFQPLAIKALGMVSALGVGAEFNAAAIRCGYDGFESAGHIYPDHTGLIMAKTGIDLQIRGNSRLKAMALQAIEDLVSSVEHMIEVDVYICIPNLAKNGVTAGKDAFRSILEAVKIYSKKIHIGETYGFAGGKTSVGVALQKAQASLCVNNKQILIIMVDSLITPASIKYYSNDKYDRLLSEKNVDGFIPGEAAVALLVGKPEDTEVTTHITSIGFAKEPVTIDNEEDVFKAEGLTKATFNALAPLNIYADDTDFRIASVSGESYFFTELTLTHGKTMKKARTEHPLWHPADCIGEVGAAMGGAMLVMAHYAFSKQYAPGNKALYHLSNDNSERFTFVLEYVNGK